MFGGVAIPMALLDPPTGSEQQYSFEHCSITNFNCTRRMEFVSAAETSDRNGRMKNNLYIPKRPYSDIIVFLTLTADRVAPSLGRANEHRWF